MLAGLPNSLARSPTPRGRPVPLTRPLAGRPTRRRSLAHSPARRRPAPSPIRPRAARSLAHSPAHPLARTLAHSPTACSLAHPPRGRPVPLTRPLAGPLAHRPAGPLAGAHSPTRRRPPVPAHSPTRRPTRSLTGPGPSTLAPSHSIVTVVPGRPAAPTSESRSPSGRAAGGSRRAGPTVSLRIAPGRGMQRVRVSRGPSCAGHWHGHCGPTDSDSNSVSESPAKWSLKRPRHSRRLSLRARHLARGQPAAAAGPGLRIAWRHWATRARDILVRRPCRNVTARQLGPGQSPRMLGPGPLSQAAADELRVGQVSIR
jgi:hypothetical protein